ncbi:NlpC/P60 family protein [Acuticoccus sp. MNP-M23]|uniref:C40 family peptidase n=1 Tax=Acuticoccus sp. MNP-M23 TaxID=3072793 RepID=UPI002816349B|nr:NlpC/P60 family protein [Acuticoccus sp. MNP-M23]WMS43057.1 NlpC/P60 family protein [Acuticoccus sp. MNP-M23]
MTLDPRLNAVRDDLADDRLAATASALRYVSPERFAISAPIAPVFRVPGAEHRETEFLSGEPVDVFETVDGWAWVQSASDGYVGYVRAHVLGAPMAPTHRVSVPHALVFAGPSIRAVLQGHLPLSARVTVAETLAGKDVFHRLVAADGATTGYVLGQHIGPLQPPRGDWVRIAEAFVGTPYLWGGKSWNGIDCSAILQLAIEASGGFAPRDSDMQWQGLGERHDAAASALTRGDLVFWKGHVGVMLDETRFLHANGFHMATAIEPLATTIARLEAQDLPVLGVRHVAPESAHTLPPMASAA